MEIRSKAEFFALWEAGLLGNRTQLWRDPLEAALWGAQRSLNTNGGLLKPEIGFRELRKPGTSGAGKWQKVPWSKVRETAAVWRSEGRDFICDDGAPDDKRTLCGEICRTYRGLEGSLGVVQCPMREAMAKGLLLPRSPATVMALIYRYMDPSSQDDLWQLLELYPNAAIELSCFTVNVGVFPRRNTIFWEVRDY